MQSTDFVNEHTEPETPATITRLGLIAGEGELPVEVLKSARAKGLDVVVFGVGSDSQRELNALASGQYHPISMGEFRKNRELFQSEQLSHIVFAGKVNKWVLFKNLRLDAEALKFAGDLALRNDDGIMLALIALFAESNLEVVSQTQFLRSFFLAEACLTEARLTAEDEKDVAYGFRLAKEMGRLDVGQTVVVNQQMVLAVEAIEGTDECLKRAGQLGRKRGGAVVKVAKPQQDQRFDVPTVGLRTLKTMRKAGLRVLATEANETLYLDKVDMVAYANQHNMVIVSVVCESPSAGSCSASL